LLIVIFKQTHQIQLKSEEIMKRIVHKSKDYEEAERWDIKQQKEMTSQERQAAAKELKRRVYGENPPDVREAERSK